MEKQKAHALYQQFSDVHAAAKSGRGLGFNAGGDLPASWKADESFERWQPSTKPNVIDSDSSRPVTHKKEKGRHRSHDGYTKSSRGDKHARQDDESRSDKGIDRHRIDRDSHWRHADRDDTRSHSKRVIDDRKCRSNRPNQRDCNRQSQDYEHWDRQDREDARDRSRHHDSRSRDEKGREQWHRATGTSRSRSEHYEHRGERDRDDPRNRSSHRERKPQDGKGREQRHRVTENSHSRPDASGRSKEAKVDFERAIPGYAQMRAAERMKARTKLLLDKSSKQDLQHAKEGQWTRYVFNRDALLDEEGATPADGFSGDANAVSLRLPQAKAETQQRMMTAEEAHEAAIFGKSSTSALPQSQLQREEPPSMMGGGGLGLGAQPSWTNAATEVMETEPASRDANSPETMVAASVLHAQPGLSWRERAALKRKQLAGES